MLWRKTLNIDMNIIKYEDDKILMGIYIKSTWHDLVLFLLNVYMPTESEENFNDFTFYMYKIHTIFRNNGTVNNIAIGDFNANLRKASLFGTELHRFVSNKSCQISDKQILPLDTFTFYSAAHDTVSWLNYILCSTSMHQSIIDMTMLYKILTSDHF